jgi:hypothetical protein
VTAPPEVGTDHEHAWTPKVLEFAECGPVEELECDLCGEVWFR